MITDLLPSYLQRAATPDAATPYDTQDRYRGVPLGVECAWPAAAVSGRFTEPVPTAA